MKIDVGSSSHHFERTIVLSFYLLLSKKKSCGTCTRRRKKTVYDFGVIALKGVNFNWPFISIIVGFRARISERRS